MLRRLTIILALGALAIGTILPGSVSASHGPTGFSVPQFNWSCSISITNNHTDQTREFSFRYGADISRSYDGDAYSIVIACEEITG